MSNETSPRSGGGGKFIDIVEICQDNGYTLMTVKTKGEQTSWKKLLIQLLTLIVWEKI